MAHLRNCKPILPVLLIVASGLCQEEKKALLNEPSRTELAEFAAALEPRTRAFPYEFKFPDDTRTDRVFGIDISHYQENVDWDKVANQQIRFVYIKATQGARYYDPTFDRNWKAVANIELQDSSLRRGTYHFMTASDAPNLQAQNFLSTVGKLGANDLPPCLDLEWDWLTKNQKYVLNHKGQRIDKWASLSSAEIVERATTWLRLVQAATGKKPIIYTTSSWWSKRIGSNSSLSEYPFWIADFTSKSLGREDPSVPERLAWSFWQLTDQGILTNGGIKKRVDTTIFHGDAAELNRRFGFK